MSEFIRTHRFIERTKANGPGWRAALWLQGCTLHCPGCFNPETHSSRGGELLEVDELARRILAIAGIQGLSLLGGEPLQQRRAVLALLRRLRADGSLSVVLFTGYTLEEVRVMPEGQETLALVDVLIAGRYDETQRFARGLRGSRNKTVTMLTSRYSHTDFEEVPACEVLLDADGVVTINGMDPLRW
jgi:anaerobic ribonucleoside-triphosphate reductase activating protein